MPNHNEIYRNQAEMYERMISKQPALADKINEIRAYRGLDVVDLGAGSGRLSSFIAPEAKSLMSTDASRSMLDVLERKLSALNLNNWSTVVADHRSLPIKTATKDLVVSGWSICYLTNSDQPDWQSNLRTILSEIRRILRPNGTIIIFETMGTGTEEPNPPAFLTPYYRSLVEEYDFSHQWIRADYNFADLGEAKELIGFFFGDEMANKVHHNNWITVPECAGIWWKHL